MDDDDDNEPLRVGGRVGGAVWGRRFTAGEVALWNLAGLAGIAPPDEAYPSASVLEWALEALEDNPDLRDVGELAAGTVNAVRAFLGRKGLLEEVGKVEVRTRLEEVSDEELFEEHDRDRERLFQGSLVRRWRTVPEGAKVLWPELLDADGSLRVRTEGEGAGLLVLDVLLAELLEELGQPKTAAKVRATPAEERGRRWKRPTSPCPGPSELAPKACSVVMQAVWKRILAERERAAQAGPAVVMHVEHAGASYVQAPKLLSGIAWAFGTDGQRVEEPGPAEVVDGDEYRQAPKVARYVSRSLGLVPAGRLKQGLLPVETTADALAVRVLADSQALVSGVGGKVALLLAVLSPQGGGLCRMSVDALCRMLWPASKRGPQLRDRQAAVKAAQALRELFVVLPNTVNFRLWDIAAPDAQAPGGELPITFGWSKNAEAHELGGADVGMLRGRFLLNLSGAMRLSADYALELRAYLHAAAGWNEARREGAFDAAFAPKGTAEELAARVNALSAPAVQYLAERGKGRRQAAADDKRRVVEALERLADEARLVRLERVGRDGFRLLPPAELLEAYELMRKHGARPAK